MAAKPLTQVIARTFFCLTSCIVTLTPATSQAQVQYINLQLNVELPPIVIDGNTYVATAAHFRRAADDQRLVGMRVTGPGPGSPMTFGTTVANAQAIAAGIRQAIAEAAALPAQITLQGLTLQVNRGNFEFKHASGFWIYYQPNGSWSLRFDEQSAFSRAISSANLLQLAAYFERTVPFATALP